MSTSQYLTTHAVLTTVSETTFLTGRRKLVSIMAHPAASAATLTFKNAAGNTILVLRTTSSVTHFWEPAVPIDVTGLTVTPSIAGQVFITVSHSRSL